MEEEGLEPSKLSRLIYSQIPLPLGDSSRKWEKYNNQFCRYIFLVITLESHSNKIKWLDAYLLELYWIFLSNKRDNSKYFHLENYINSIGCIDFWKNSINLSSEKFDTFTFFFQVFGVIKTRYYYDFQFFLFGFFVDIS